MQIWLKFIEKLESDWQRVDHHRLKFGLAFLLILVFVFVFVYYPDFEKKVAPAGEAVAFVDSFPKLANYYLKSPISDTEAVTLAKWDVVILGMQIQDTSPRVFEILRRENPDIKIIAYLSGMEFPLDNFGRLESNDGPWHKMFAGLKNEWWLKDGRGGYHSVWSGNRSFNVTDNCPKVAGKRFNDFLPEFVKKEVMEKADWDGVYFDNVLDGIKFTNSGWIDIDGNGEPDDHGWVDSEWKKGMKEILSKTRNLIGKNKIILVNSSSYGSEYFNGRLYETWPSPWYGGWSGEMTDYQKLQNNSNFFPAINILNPNTENTGRESFQKVRFGLTSALLEDGYFAYDFGTNDHSQLWWYDEYNVQLGQPLNNAKQVNGASNKNGYNDGVWRRDFVGGIVLVNATDQNQTIDLDGGVTYEKIKGEKDKSFNDGSLVRKITLSPKDGVVLLRKLGTPLIAEDAKKEAQTGPVATGLGLENFVFTNGAFVRVFDKRGESKRAGFYAFESLAEGGDEVLIIDLDLDGEKEKIIAGKKSIKIYSSHNELKNIFYPYGLGFDKGINIDAGNVMGDSKLEIVTGVKSGAGPHVKIFDNFGGELSSGFMAYHPDFRGGVNVALGDLNGNGYKEIITGAGFGGGPQVLIFDATGHLFDPGFFPYNKNFRGGVYVTTGDLNGDGLDEIITGVGKTGGPHVRIYDKIGHLVDPGFFAFAESKREGVRVGAVDIDGDGLVEILGMN
jgi:hypothetical protein